MKKKNVSKLSRTELKNVFGGDLYPALNCPGGCYQEAFIQCPDGTTTMTDSICVNGQCVVNTGVCKPLILLPIDPVDP